MLLPSSRLFYSPACFFSQVKRQILEQSLSPLRYVDPCHPEKHTEEYPFNPNGSPDGMAALCSPDGRHLAMMPHPERCWLDWQVRSIERVKQ